MKRARKVVWIVFVLLLLIAAGAFQYIRSNASWQENYRKTSSERIVNLIQTNPYDQLNVVVIVIDGLRWSEGIGREDKYIPHIWNDLRPMGTLLTNYWDLSPTATTSVHTAFLTGRISTVPNDGHIRPVFPTMLEYYRDARSDYVDQALSTIIDPPPGIFWPDAKSRAEIGGLASEARDFDPDKTALYLGKDLIYSLNQSSSGRYPADDVLLVDSMRDIEVEEYFRAKIPDVKPNMIFVNLGDVDECAHEAQWFYYVDSIRAADKLVWQMWQALQEQKKYRDKTIFVVTTDHGRHIPARGGFPHHGCFCDGCRHTFMLLIGPNIERGFVSDQQHSEIDLAPTIGAALGFSTPGCQGAPITEAFETPAGFPTPRQTPTSLLVAADKVRADERDTGKLLLDAVLEKTPKSTWGGNVETAMLLLAASARIENHPEEATDLLMRLPVIDEVGLPMADYGDLVLAYPFIALGRANENSGSTVCFGFAQRGGQMLYKASGAGLIGPWEVGGSPDIPDMKFAALTAAALAGQGRADQNIDFTRSAYALLLDALTRLEGEQKVWTGTLDDFIKDYRYREGPNEIFTERSISMPDRIWLFWGIERVLAESDPTHVPDLHPVLERQYRLLVAFCNEWQDANAMIGGTGDLGEDIDFPAQGLSLAAMAEFKPWRRWELDQLGYSPTIYATPLFDFPFEHLFYILGQANALAGAWTADERLKLYVNDDGTIRRDLLDHSLPYRPADPDYALTAASLAYGLGRFEKADYADFDLELYPLVHQQTP